MAKKDKEDKSSDEINEHLDLGDENTEDTMETEEKLSNETTEKVENNEPPTCEERFAELNNKYVRLYSDFDNFRKRTIKEKADIISTASAGVIKDLLVVLDDFERAIANNEKVEDVATLREGFKLIHHKMELALQNKGLEAIDAKGEVFDADKHEAITNVPVEDKNQKGKVIDVVERGYNLHGRALRYAKVIVGQ